MKKIALVFVAAIISAATFAQRTAIDKVANAACDCINNTELDQNMNQQDAELFLGQCMAPSIMANMDALMKEMKIKEFNQESGYQIGMEVGKKLGAICPKFIELSIIMARNANEEVPVEEEYDESESDSEIESGYVKEDAEIVIAVGRFVREEGGAQRYIVVNVDGVEEKFLWLYFFDGSDDIVADPSFYLNHEVYVEYITIEMFDGISRSYFPAKVLVSLLNNE
jgi:hypothetical protein